MWRYRDGHGPQWDFIIMSSGNNRGQTGHKKGDEIEGRGTNEVLKGDGVREPFWLDLSYYIPQRRSSYKTECLCWKINLSLVTQLSISSLSIFLKFLSWIDFFYLFFFSNTRFILAVLWFWQNISRDTFVSFLSDLRLYHAPGKDRFFYRLQEKKEEKEKDLTLVCLFQMYSLTTTAL